MVVRRKYSGAQDSRFHAAMKMAPTSDPALAMMMPTRIGARILQLRSMRRSREFVLDSNLETRQSWVSNFPRETQQDLRDSRQVCRCRW